MGRADQSMDLSVAAVLLGVFCVDAAWVLLSRRAVDWASFAPAVLAMAAMLAPLAIERYRSDVRIAATARGAAVLVAFVMVSTPFSYLVVSTNAPTVDAALDAWDRALGFDWIALQAWLQSHPAWQSALRAAYQSGPPQIVLVVVFLGFSARPDRLDEFLRLFILATLACVLVSGPFPAAGTWKHYGARGVDLSILSHFEALRSGAMREISLSKVQGLISIPSLHAAMAVLLVYAVRGTALLPALAALNAAMLVSTPVDGSHYLVDVLAGVALAGLLIAINRARRTG
jgi:membrane-associated phospholipid phosphatase